MLTRNVIMSFLSLLAAGPWQLNQRSLENAPTLEDSDKEKPV